MRCGIKTATAKELRNRAAAILESVRKGAEITITMRGKPIATLTPFKKNTTNFTPVGFGMWRKRKDMRNVSRWLDERRKERFQR